MAFDISGKNHAELDKLTRRLLEAYKNGDIDSRPIEGLIGHIIAAAAKDNEGEILAWLKYDQQARWFKEAKNAKRT